MYNSSCAIYTPPYFKLFDIIAPIRIVHKDKKSETEIYAPFAVSVKARSFIAKSEINQILVAMQKFMKKANVKKAICVLLLLDWEEQ
jgi:hypothetical protein